MRVLADLTVAGTHKLDARAGFMAKRCLGRPASRPLTLWVTYPALAVGFNKSFEADQPFGLAGGLGQGGDRGPFFQDIKTRNR